MPTYTLSWPPSTNSLWRAVRGRNILSRQYRLWQDKAEEELFAQGLVKVDGPVTIDIELNSPHKRRYDPDNRVKAILDMLVRTLILEDDNDSFIHRLTVYTQLGGFEGATVKIRKVRK